LLIEVIPASNGYYSYHKEVPF